MKGLFGFGKKKEAQTQQDKWLIQYDRKVCIGSGTCAAVCERHWKMLDDGKAELIGSTFNQETQMFEKTVDDPEFECNKAAADGCPPNCIHIINRETGEKLI
jgi:ferredoxin